MSKKTPTPPALPGPRAYIHPTALVEPGAKIGDGTKVWHHSHIRTTATIGPRCTLGKNVFIDAGVVVGYDCKIQNNVSLYHGLILGNRVFVGPHVCTTNDKRPRATGEWVLEHTYLDDGCSIGAHVTLVCNIIIGQYAMVGAGAVVTRSVAPYTLVVGNPARPVGYVCRSGHRLRQRANADWYCTTCGDCLKIGFHYAVAKTATK